MYFFLFFSFFFARGNPARQKYKFNLKYYTIKKIEGIPDTLFNKFKVKFMWNIWCIYISFIINLFLRQLFELIPSFQLLVFVIVTLGSDTTNSWSEQWSEKDSFVLILFISSCSGCLFFSAYISLRWCMRKKYFKILRFKMDWFEIRNLDSIESLKYYGPVNI